MSDYMNHIILSFSLLWVRKDVKDDKRVCER